MLHHMALAEPGDVRTVSLETGATLRVEEILNSRILPHAYVDQAMSSIPGVYPESKILAKRRFFQLGKGDSVSAIAIICYKKDSKKPAVTISGVTISRGKAWHFGAEIEESQFPETLIAVLAELSKLPGNQPLKETPCAQK